MYDAIIVGARSYSRDPITAQEISDAFIDDLSAITGAIPLPDFMSDENLGRIMAVAKDAALHA